MSGKRAPARTGGRTGRAQRLDRAFCAALAVLAVPAGVAMAPPAAARAPSFRAPEGPLVLTREVRRTLADGQQLVVRRRYLVHFTPAGGGYTVTGDLTGVEVEAPAAMADLAEVERQRADLGLFPLQLDAAGLIVARPAPAATPEEPGGAASARTAMAAYLARTDLTPAERTAAQAMAIKLQAQGQAAGNAWPADLFHPAPGTRSEQRDLTLPDGRAGQVTVTVAASGHAGGLLAEMERKVVTRLEGTERTSLERWTLGR